MGVVDRAFKPYPRQADILCLCGQPHVDVGLLHGVVNRDEFALVEHDHPASVVLVHYELRQMGARLVDNLKRAVGRKVLESYEPFRGLDPDSGGETAAASSAAAAIGGSRVH